MLTPAKKASSEALEDSSRRLEAVLVKSRMTREDLGRINLVISGEGVELTTANDDTGNMSLEGTIADKSRVSHTIKIGFSHRGKEDYARTFTLDGNALEKDAVKQSGNDMLHRLLPVMDAVKQRDLAQRSGDAKVSAEQGEYELKQRVAAHQEKVNQQNNLVNSLI